MDKEKSRRTEELTEKEYERRVAIAHKMLDVQKELLATHKPLKVHSRCMQLASSPDLELLLPARKMCRSGKKYESLRMRLLHHTVGLSDELMEIYLLLVYSYL